MVLIKSIIIWIAGISVLVLLFPVTFIIWLLVLPFDKRRVIIHWILVSQGMILARIFSFRKIDIDGTGGILPKHGLIFGSGSSLRIRVLEPILPSSFETTNPDDLALKISSLMSSQLKELRTSDFTR